MSLYFVKFAWKNIWRNRRRTLITIQAIALGLMALIAIHNYYDAFHEQVISNVIRFHSGHVSLAHVGYAKDNQRELYLKNPAPVLEFLRHDPSVVAFGERIWLQGLLSSAHGSASVLFGGIRPEVESHVTGYAQNMVKGTYFGRSSKATPIVLGTSLASTLGVDVGSKLVALTQGVDGSIGNELFSVSGIFHTESDADKSLAFVPLGTARSLSSVPQGALHQISVLLKSETDIQPFLNRCHAAFPPSLQIEALPWTQVQRHVVAMIELDKAVNRLLMTVILVVASLGVANAILMGLMERTREFGVMMAMGTSSWRIVKLAVAETLWLAAVGAFLGNIFGITVTEFFHWKGFDLRWLTRRNLVIDGAIIRTVNYPSIHWGNNIQVSVTILALAFVAALWPAHYMARLKVTDALRTH